MNERIKSLRSTLKLTQQDFADRLGIKRGSIANYELGRNEPIDAVISLICREFNVSEEWLRTGQGEMFVEISRDEEIAGFIGKVLGHEQDSFKHRLLSVLSRLDESQWEVLEGMARDAVKDIEKQ